MSDRDIAESILENNLFGIDIDPRAVQIAAAALYLKARSFAAKGLPKDPRVSRLRRVNLVAPSLKLGDLPEDDEAVLALCGALRDDAGIPETATRKLLKTLAGVDYLGSLLKVDASLDQALRDTERSWRDAQQTDLFSRDQPDGSTILVAAGERQSLTRRLEEFLTKHSSASDLGLRLDGEQLSAGVRFVRIAKEGTYDVVVGNPPYQGLTKTNQFDYVAKEYPRGKADLYGAFLERGLQMVRPGGISALLTMRGWMFLGQFTSLRIGLLREMDLRVVGDVDRGAFEDVPDEVLATVLSVIRRAPPSSGSVAIQPTPAEDRARDGGRTVRKRAALLAQVGRYEFDPRGFEVIEGEPLVYWWAREFLARYAAAPKLGDIAPVRSGAATSDNTRFIRRPHEVDGRSVAWAPYVKGGEGRAWCDPQSSVILWNASGLQVRAYTQHEYGSYTRQIKNEAWYFKKGIAFSAIGAAFAARLHSYPGVFDVMGQSVFPGEDRLATILCAMNRRLARDVLQSLNPTIHFQVSDVSRLPLFYVDQADDIVGVVTSSFTTHESVRETSVEFRRPGGSAWIGAQSWAQLAVDRLGGAPLPPYEPIYEAPLPVAFVSFALGVALGRFGADGEGILDAAPATALSNGILFLSTERGDSLDHLACQALVASWNEHGTAVSPGDDLRTYLRKSFFDFHKKLYENRPIYFPLSSAKKSFVAFISIHRWANDTLSVLLADHLVPARRRLDGELEDLRAARAAPGANKNKLEKRLLEVQKAAEELADFIAKVTDLAEKGPPPPDDKTPKREVDARYMMDLDDGVMVNSAALWPVLEPQWKDPKKWWKELASATGKKDYDWSHLAARYFPTRVRAKCHEDPSLAVAHGCFWELHPAKAYAWELRLKDEIRPDFTIDEAASDASREAFLKAHAAEAREIEAKEKKRREKKGAKEEEQTELAYEAGEGDGADE